MAKSMTVVALTHDPIRKLAIVTVIGDDDAEKRVMLPVPFGCELNSVRTKPCQYRKWRKIVAGAKGLEPSASAVTGQRSNQLSYAPARVLTSFKGSTPCRSTQSAFQVC